MKSGKFANVQFHRLLKQCKDEAGNPFTVGMLAAGINSGRPHVTRVLLNQPSRTGQYANGVGGRTRNRLAAYFIQNFPKQADGLLEALGWDRQGKLVPRGENHVEHSA